MLMLPDLFHFWLCGAKGIECTNASTTQMLNNRDCSWATELIEDLGIRTNILPPIVQPGTVLGRINPNVADQTGLNERTAVVATATHDTASAVAAIPDLDERSAFLSSGTWSLIGIESDSLVVNEEAYALNFGNEIGAAGTRQLLKNIDGMWIIDGCRRRWNRDGLNSDWTELLALADAAPPFRSLINPNSSLFYGLCDHTTAIRSYCRRTRQPEPEGRGAIVRCCLESLALSYRLAIDALEHLAGRKIATIRIVGGGSQNRLHCQLVADVTRRAVVAGPTEATSYGNVMIQAITMKYLPDLAAGRQAMARSIRTVRYEPRGSSSEIEDAVSRFVVLIESDSN
jgi:rhamnulokinase